MDPYQVLEIAPGATREEIEAAYKRLARIYHPDRHTSQSASAQQRAVIRMRELNEARDLLRKGGYRWDSYEAPKGNGQTSYPSGFPRSEPYYDPRSRLEFNRRVRRGVAFWVLLGIVIASVGVYLSSPPRLYVRSDRLALGECFVSPGSKLGGRAPFREGHEEVRVTDCHQPHEGQVYAVIEHPAPRTSDFPGSSEIMEYGLSSCALNFEKNISTSISSSVLSIGVYSPDVSAWRVSRNRALTCFVWSYQGPLNRSVTG